LLSEEEDMKDSLLEQIDLLFEQYVRIWEDVCNIESPTHDKAGVDEVGAYFIKYAQERGWHVEVTEYERAGNVVTVTANPDAPGAPIAFSGHMDTVHERGSFGYPPTKIVGDTIYGPGVTDCKGGIVAGFLAMDALCRAGYCARPLKMYLQSDEEGGGKFSADATILGICEDAKGSVAFFNLEGYEGGICVERKGIATFEFLVEGVEAHSAACATMGANAILEAAYKIIELEKFKDRSGLTCSCTVIKGGTKHNIVPGECRFSANVRFANNAQLDSFREFCDKLCEDIKVEGCKCSYVLPRVRPAMENCERNLNLASRINEIWRECGLSEMAFIRKLGGSDAAFATSAGIPCIDSLGTAGGKIHTVYEYSEIPSLREHAMRLALASLYL
jgi:glutamate carboxypeptidase